MKLSGGANGSPLALSLRIPHRSTELSQEPSNPSGALSLSLSSLSRSLAHTELRRPHRSSKALFRLICEHSQTLVELSLSQTFFTSTIEYCTTVLDKSRATMGVARSGSGVVAKTQACQRKADKLAKKLKFYTSVKDTVVALAAKKAINKKRRTRSRQRKAKTYDLSSLAEFLPNLDDLKQPDPHPLKLKVDCKNRRKLLEKEHDQFRAVLDHPAFQSEPIAAVYQHLEKTCSLLADDNGSKRLVARSKKGEAYGSKRKKGSKSKILPDAQSMLLN